MEKNQEIIYQINPHMFTPTGTLLEASKMLPHLQKTGVTMVYLFAILLSHGYKNGVLKENGYVIFRR